MKTTEELANEVIKKVREISPNSLISDSDIACIAGITSYIMYAEDIVNMQKRISTQDGNHNAHQPLLKYSRNQTH